MRATVVDVANELAANPGCSVIVALAGNSRMIDDLGWEWLGGETMNVVTVEQVHDSMVIYTKNGRQFEGVNPNAKSFVIISVDDGKPSPGERVTVVDIVKALHVNPGATATVLLCALMMDDDGKYESGKIQVNACEHELDREWMISTTDGRKFSGVRDDSNIFHIISIDQPNPVKERDGLSLEDFARSIGIDPDIKKSDPIRTRVFLASPYAGEVEDNLEYAKLCLLDSIDRGEAPIAPHLIYPQVLDDRKPSSRKDGIDCGLAWLESAEKLVAYVDRGVSKGMALELKRAAQLGIEIEIRVVGE